MSENEQTYGRQIAAARALAAIGQQELATRAKVSVATLRRMEASEGPAEGMPNNVAAVRRALESAGVEFTNGGQPGVRLKRTDGKVSADDLIPPGAPGSGLGNAEAG